MCMGLVGGNQTPGGIRWLENIQSPVDDAAYAHTSRVESCHLDDGVSDLLCRANMYRSCASRCRLKQSTGERRGWTAKTVLQKTASSNVNAFGIFGDRDLN